MRGATPHEDNPGAQFQQEPPVSIDFVVFNRLDLKGKIVASLDGCNSYHMCYKCFPKKQLKSFQCYVDHTVQHLIHTPFKCQKCEKYFGTSVDLGNHQDICKLNVRKRAPKSNKVKASNRRERRQRRRMERSKSAYENGASINQSVFDHAYGQQYWCAYDQTSQHINRRSTRSNPNLYPIKNKQYSKRHVQRMNVVTRSMTLIGDKYESLEGNTFNNQSCVEDRRTQWNRNVFYQAHQTVETTDVHDESDPNEERRAQWYENEEGHVEKGHVEKGHVEKYHVEKGHVENGHAENDHAESHVENGHLVQKQMGQNQIGQSHVRKNHVKEGSDGHHPCGLHPCNSNEERRAQCNQNGFKQEEQTLGPNDMRDQSNSNVCHVKKEPLANNYSPPPLVDPRRTQCNPNRPLSWRICQVCGLKYGNEEELLDHTITHLVDKDVEFYHIKKGRHWKCHICHQRFATVHRLQKHIKFIHEGPSDLTYGNCNGGGYDEAIFAARQKCIREIYRRFYLHKQAVGDTLYGHHVMRRDVTSPSNVHPPQPTLQNGFQQPYQTKYDDGCVKQGNADDDVEKFIQQFTSISVDSAVYEKLDYQGHPSKAGTSYQCPKCDFSCLGFIGYIDHVISHIVKTRNFRRFCSSSFEEVKDLRSHPEEGHAEEGHVESGHLVQNQIGRSHVRKNHVREGSDGHHLCGLHPCKICGMKFLLPDLCTNHENVAHIGMSDKQKARSVKKALKVKRYPCRICGKKFSKIVGRNDHENSVHQGMSHKKEEKAIQMQTNDSKHSKKNSCLDNELVVNTIHPSIPMTTSDRVNSELPSHLH